MLLVAVEVQFFDLLNFAFASSGVILSSQWSPITRGPKKIKNHVYIVRNCFVRKPFIRRVTLLQKGLTVVSLYFII